MPFGELVALGVLVGLAIGLTGMGSGSLLTPLLILLGGLSPAGAVATSLAFSFATKLYGSWSFYRRGMVKWEVARDFILGGLVGSLASTFVIRFLVVQHAQALDALMLRAIGLVLILVSLLMLLRLLPANLRPAVFDRPLPLSDHQRRRLILPVAFVLGVIVTITSIGSGTVLIPAMVLLYRLDSGTLVGTSVFVGTVLGAIAGLSYAGLGNLDWRTVAALLFGSVPALWLASRHHARTPRAISEAIIAATLMGLGVRISIM